MKDEDKRYAEWLLSKTVSNGECLECHLPAQENGYVKIYGIGQAHRAVYQGIKGPISNELYVLHTCDNRCCIRPDHLFLGTHQDNMTDMFNKGRHKAKRSPLLTIPQQWHLYYLISQDVSYNIIGALFGVTKQTVYKYATGQRGIYAYTSR